MYMCHYQNKQREESEKNRAFAGMNLLSYFCIAVSAIQNHNCVAVFDFN